MSAVIAKRSSRQKLMVVAGAVGLAFATHGRHACGDVTESWIAGGGGNWTSAANWSPSANYPNNGTPAGTDYQASIALPGSSAYTVSVNSNLVVDGLSIGSSNATLDDVSGGALNLRALSVVTGTFEFNGGALTAANGTATYFVASAGQFDLNAGTINGGTLSAANNQNCAFEDGILNNVTLNGLVPSTFDGTYLTIRNGLTGTGQNFTLNGGTMDFDGASQQLTDMTLSNGDNDASLYSVVDIGGATSKNTSTLTIGSSSAISAVNGSCVILPYSDINAALINNGIISATPGNILSIEPEITFTNNGLLSVQSSAIISMQETTWTNAAGATMSVGNNGTLTLFNAGANSGTIRLSGGTINAVDGVNVGDGTLGGSGTINGSVTLTSDPSQLAFQIGGKSQGSTYDSLTVNGNLTLAGDLDIAFSNGFQSSITGGEQFILVTVGSSDAISGSFLNVSNGSRLETTDGYGSFLVSYGSGQFTDEIVLSSFEATVPEPASSCILIAGSALLLARRRGLQPMIEK